MSWRLFLVISVKQTKCLLRLKPVFDVVSWPSASKQQGRRMGPTTLRHNTNANAWASLLDPCMPHTKFTVRPPCVKIGTTNMYVLPQHPSVFTSSSIFSRTACRNDNQVAEKMSHTSRFGEGKQHKRSAVVQFNKNRKAPSHLDCLSSRWMGSWEQKVQVVRTPEKDEGLQPIRIF